MILYHSTTPGAAESILSEGFRDHTGTLPPMSTGLATVMATV